LAETGAGGCRLRIKERKLPFGAALAIERVTPPSFVFDPYL